MIYDRINFTGSAPPLACTCLRCGLTLPYARCQDWPSLTNDCEPGVAYGYCAECGRIMLHEHEPQESETEPLLF